MESGVNLRRNNLKASEAQLGPSWGPTTYCMKRAAWLACNDRILYSWGTTARMIMGAAAQLLFS